MQTEFDDLTNQTQGQSLPQFEKKWLEIAFNSVRDCLFLLSVEQNGNYKFISVNERFLTVTAKTKAEVIGKFFEEIIPLPPDSELLDKFREAISEKKTVSSVESPVYPTGKHIGKVKITPLKDETTGQIYLLGAVHDITALREKQDALKRTEEVLGVALRTSRDSFVIIRLSDEMILDANNGWLNATGFEREEVIGKPLADLNIWNNAEERQQFAALIREHGSVRDFEFAYRNKAGETRSGIFSSGVIELDGEPCAFVTGHDITARRRAEEALRASEAELRALFAAMSDVIFVFNREGRYLKVAPTNPDILIRPPEELLGQTLNDIFPEETANFFIEQIQNSLAANTKVSIEYSLIIRGQELWFAAAIAPMTNETAIWVARDITFIKQAEKDRLESENLYRQTVENANDIIYTVDLNGRFVSINRAGEIITGYTLDEFRQINVADIVAPEYLDLVREKMALKNEFGVQTTYEIEIIAKDKRRVALEINSRLLEKDDLPFRVLGIARDITERKRAAKKLNEVEEQLRQAQKLESIGLLAGGIAHDFNNMLTAINGYSDLILRRMSENDSLRPMVEEIRNAGERAGELTRQLLAFSRKQILQPKTLNINDVVRDIANLLKRLIGEDIKLQMSLKKNLGQVEADPGQMTQVLMNLAVNARDAMPKGGTLVIETDSVYLDETYARQHVNLLPGRYVLLAVSDNGVGIDPNVMEHIFEPFFTTKETGKGTGMGLATVYGIVKQSRGDIRAYSELGKGTTFKIYLPLIDKEAESIEENSPDSRLPAGNEKILLVEDEEMVRNLSKEILETCGYLVIEAANGADAVKMCEEKGIAVDLLITDLVMPEMGGRDLVERLTKSRPSLRVLYISGYTDNAIVQHGILNKGTNFIQKPFTLQAFAQKVREVLDSP